MVCPYCGSKLVRRSMRRTFKDRMLSLIGKWPYRCLMCNVRFSGPQDPESIARDQAHRLADEDEVQTEDASPDPGGNQPLDKAKD